MKIIIPILVLLFSFSCNSSKEEAVEMENFDVLPLDTIETTSYQYPEVKLPKNFKILNIQIEDTSTSQLYFASCLQSDLTSLGSFNQSIQAALLEYINAQKTYLDTSFYNQIPDGMDVNFYSELHPIDIFINHNIISVTYIENSFLERSPHYNYHWFSFNYDLRENKPILFEDIFNINTSQDSTNFIDYVLENKLRDCIGIYQPYEHLDFSFSAKGIYINPRLSWACSLNRSLLKKEDLKFLNPKWKNVFK